MNTLDQKKPNINREEQWKWFKKHISPNYTDFIKDRHNYFPENINKVYWIDYVWEKKLKANWKTILGIFTFFSLLVNLAIGGINLYSKIMQTNSSLLKEEIVITKNYQNKAEMEIASH